MDDIVQSKEVPEFDTAAAAKLFFDALWPLLLYNREVDDDSFSKLLDYLHENADGRQKVFELCA